jgi:hypothetical protein
VGADSTPVVCGACQTKGQLVDELTIKALLTEHALRRFEPGSYRFCPDASCDVVYFSEDGTTFTRQDVRVRIWQKEPAEQRTVCYCFDETESGIARELADTGVSRAVERVRAHIAAHRCACEVRNPRGVCCLGDVISAVERAQAR